MYIDCPGRAQELQGDYPCAQEIKPEEYRAPGRGLPTRIIRLTGPASSILGAAYGRNQRQRGNKAQGQGADELPCGENLRG